MKYFSSVKTLLHSSHLFTFLWQFHCNLDQSHESRADLTSELVFSLLLVGSDQSRATIQAFDSQESVSQPNTPTSSERSSPKPNLIPMENSFSFWLALGQLANIQKENISWTMEGKRCFELGLERNLNSSCTHPRRAAEIRESRGKHSGEWWQVYVPWTVGHPPSQPTTSFPVGRKPGPAAGREQACVNGGRRFISYWHRVLLNLDLPQTVLIW